MKKKQGKRALALALALMMAAGGCAAPAPSSPPESVSPLSQAAPSAPEPPPLPPPAPEPEYPPVVQPELSLVQNAAEAGKLPANASLQMDGGTRRQWGMPVVHLWFPERWPLELTGDYLPQYPGRGWMNTGFVKSPDPQDAKAAQMVGIMLYDYQEAELSDYIATLKQLGYKDSLKPLPNDLMGYTVGPESVFLRLDWGEAVTLLLIQGADTDMNGNGPSLNIILRFNQRIAESEKPRKEQADKNAAKEGTRLLNARQAGLLPKGQEMNQTEDATRTLEKENGATTLRHLYPDRWPSKMLEGYAPVYTGDGWLYQQTTTSPDHSNEMLAEINTMVVYDYEVPQLTQYMVELQALGFTGGEPMQNVEGAPEGSLMFHFVRDDCTIHIMLGEDQFGSYVDLSVAMLSRSQKRLGTQVMSKDDFF